MRTYYNTVGRSNSFYHPTQFQQPVRTLPSPINYSNYGVVPRAFEPQQYYYPQHQTSVPVNSAVTVDPQQKTGQITVLQPQQPPAAAPKPQPGQLSHEDFTHFLGELQKIWTGHALTESKAYDATPRTPAVRGFLTSWNSPNPFAQQSSNHITIIENPEIKPATNVKRHTHSLGGHWVNIEKETNADSDNEKSHRLNDSSFAPPKAPLKEITRMQGNQSMCPAMIKKLLVTPPYNGPAVDEKRGSRVMAPAARTRRFNPSKAIKEAVLGSGTAHVRRATTLPGH